METLSKIELFYSTKVNKNQNVITLSDDEFHHAIKVMRHRIGEEINITDGLGNLYTCNISEIQNNVLSAKIVKSQSKSNRLENVSFCIPMLKAPDRFEFALEKLTELGITRIIVFNSDFGLKKTPKMERWKKIVLSAMKQSLNLYLPDLEYINKLDSVLLNGGKKVVFELSSDMFYDFGRCITEDTYFVFGPEGSLSERELSLVKSEDIYLLAENRLRSETAIIKAASQLSFKK